MCWSRGLAISRWRSLPDCLSVCLSVWAVRDVSTPIVGSGVEAQLAVYGLGRDYARRCAMAGKPSAADTARIRPLPRPTPVRPGSCPHTGGHTGGSHGAGGPTGCRRSWLLRRSKAATRRSRGWRCVAPPPLHDSPIAHAVLMPMLCSCCAHSPRVPALRPPLGAGPLARDEPDLTHDCQQLLRPNARLRSCRRLQCRIPTVR